MYIDCVFSSVWEWTRHNGSEPWQPAKWRFLNINTITSKHILVIYNVTL